MRRGLAVQGAGWLLFVASIFTGDRGSVGLGVLMLAATSVAGVMLTVTSSWRGSDPASDRRATAASVGVGAVGMLLAGVVTLLLYVFPINLIPFGFCSADPDAWICALEP